ncbi:MAG: DsbA family oxidoreductase [Polyangiaceae bacterium]
MSSDSALHVDVISDLVCPYCLLACRRLDLVRERLGGERELDIELHPFLLDPGQPPEGTDLREHLRRKFGDPEPLFRRLETVARSEGIELDFERVSRFVSTVRAHTLLTAARKKGTQWELGRALFGAYFAEGRDISDLEVLAGLASNHGFTRDEALAILHDRDELAATILAARRASQRGIRGVPFIVVGGEFTISGAQPTEVLERALRGGSAQ